MRLLALSGPSPGPLVLLRGVVVSLAALVLAGCAVRTVVPEDPPDTFADWSSTPLPPDPLLTARVLKGESACALDPAGGPQAHVVLQDRRTMHTAVFLVSNPVSFGNCVVSSSNGASGGGYGPLPGAMAGLLTIDDNGSGSAGAGEIRELGGRVAPGAARVVVSLADDRAVVASLLDGFWLAWWPTIAPAVRVIATDASGAEIATLEVTK
jgi:hypothetical protein